MIGNGESKRSIGVLVDVVVVAAVRMGMVLGEGVIACQIG